MVPLLVYAAANGMSGSAVWDDLYWQEPWQTMGAVSNSVFLWALVAAIGWRYQARLAASADDTGRLTQRSSVAAWGPFLFALGASAFVHVSFDFLVHADDAHRHFWPVSNWRFESPVSYWDTDHYARWFMPVEAMIALSSIVVLVRRSSIKRRLRRAFRLSG